ncbi:MAG: amidase family protein, partial [Steroidobacteraceae bacterium]
MQTIADAVANLTAGKRSRALIEECLDRINDKSGEGVRTFLKVYAEEALAAADFYDRLRAKGVPLSRFAGIPVSVKDLFDVAGDITTAGSVALRDALPATCDAPAVARLRAAGFIVIGRTNMTEFAFSGLGVNPYYGTPLSPFDRESARAPGGSSSGAGVSISDGMALGAAGSDTGGSCRIPAAFCGVVGFKPTASRVPTQGAFPLSTTLDSIGPLAATVECCAALDSALAAEPAHELAPFPLEGLRLAVPQTMVLDDVEPAVAQAFDRALTLLRKQGARITDIALREFAELRA